MAHDPHSHSSDNAVELPTPTAWPLVAAFSIFLLFFGLVTNISVSILGLICGLIATVGWFTDVFPHPKHEPFPIRPKDQWPKEISPEGRTVSHLQVGEHGHREQFPASAHSYAAGFTGGILGGVAMAIVALVLGLIVNGSLWYPINVLGAVGAPSLAAASDEALKSFSLLGLILGLIIHGTTSILIGLLYTVILPMLPAKREYLWGGIVIPVIWTALMAATLHFISPAMNERIEWIPFLISQITFGLVCGFYVYRTGRISTMRGLSVAARLGVEAQHPGEKHS